MKSNFESAAPTQISIRFFITENKQFHQLKKFGLKIFSESVDEIWVQSIVETTQRKIIHRYSITLNFFPWNLSVKLTHNKKILIKIFYNDEIKKKIPFKLGRNTAYSSSLWSNSPRNVGFETQNHFLEGVKKKFFIKITRLFLIFRDWSRNISGYFHKDGGQTIAKTYNVQ